VLRHLEIVQSIVVEETVRILATKRQGEMRRCEKSGFGKTYLSR
jgi:hypothetical protein